MWLRHGINIWHFDCQLISEKHDFLASVKKIENGYELYIPSSDLEKELKKNIRSNQELNELLDALGLEKLNIPDF